MLAVPAPSTTVGVPEIVTVAIFTDVLLTDGVPEIVTDGVPLIVTVAIFTLVAFVFTLAAIEIGTVPFTLTFSVEPVTLNEEFDTATVPLTGTVPFTFTLTVEPVTLKELFATVIDPLIGTLPLMVTPPITLVPAGNGFEMLVVTVFVTATFGVLLIFTLGVLPTNTVGVPAIDTVEPVTFSGVDVESAIAPAILTVDPVTFTFVATFTRTLLDVSTRAGCMVPDGFTKPIAVPAFGNAWL